MHPRTTATLANLQEATWFDKVGVQDTEAAIVLTSWSDAVESCSSQEWQDLCLEAANRYTEQLFARDPGRFNNWNIVAAEVKQVSVPLVKGKIAEVAQRYSLSKAFEDCVQWDIMHLLMEAEYADVFPPGFFASQAYWYVKGHFPCGWSGQFPQGKLIIF